MDRFEGGKVTLLKRWWRITKGRRCRGFIRIDLDWRCAINACGQESVLGELTGEVGRFTLLGRRFGAD